MNDKIEQERLKKLWEIKRAKRELMNAMMEFAVAWDKLAGAMSDTNIDCNDYIVDDYPFATSFDEINIDDWVDSTVSNIEKELK